MNKEIVKRFVSQKVKLIRGNHAIYGIIIAVEDDCILFETNTTTSALSLDCISEIVPHRGDSDE